MNPIGNLYWRNIAMQFREMGKLFFVFSVLMVLLLSNSADARVRGYRDGGYVALAPGVIYVPIGGREFTRNHEVGYQWGVGAGAMVKLHRRAMLGIGLGVEHDLLHYSDRIQGNCRILNCAVRGNLFRVTPELRIGGLAGPVWYYGLAAPGVVLHTIKVDGNGVLFRDGDDVDVGANFGLGFGFQAKVSGNFFVGSEVGIDLGLIFDGERDGRHYENHIFDMKALLGWHF